MQRVTPSYVKMPIGYPRLACSGRTALGATVLNDTHVNVITGSEVRAHAAQSLCSLPL